MHTSVWLCSEDRSVYNAVKFTNYAFLVLRLILVAREASGHALLYFKSLINLLIDVLVLLGLTGAIAVSGY